MARMDPLFQSEIDLQEFLEIVIMWHTSGDIPMTREATSEFIEDKNFSEFMTAVKHWSRKFGVRPPTQSAVVKTLYDLLNDTTRC